MSKFTINNDRPINTNSRDNYCSGGQNQIIFSTTEDFALYNTLNRICFKHSINLDRDDRYYLNIDSTIPTTQRVKNRLSEREILFNKQNDEYVLTFPPYYKQYILDQYYE